MWKSDDESNLFDTVVVNWTTPALPASHSSLPTTSDDQITNISTSTRNQIPPLPPPSPFSALFPQELLQSSGFLLSQFDDDIVNSTDPSESVQNESEFADSQSAAGNSTKLCLSPTPLKISEFPGAYHCTECIFSTDDRRLFDGHKRSKHAGEKVFSCHDCSAKFTRQYSLKKHVSQKHTSQLLPKYCPFPNCKFSTRNPSSMQLHKRNHQQFYFCKECKARYSRRQSLLGHLTKHHSSNAALIGMDPSPPLMNIADDQSLQSPPPQTSAPNDVAVISTPPNPFFQQDSGTMANAGDPLLSPVSGEDEEDSRAAPFSPPNDTIMAQSGVAKYSPYRLSADTTSNTIDAVIGSVAAAASAPPDSQSDVKFYCDKCQFSCASMRRLYGHKLSSHRRPKEKMITKTNHTICPHCPRTFASLKRMLTHVKKIHTTTMKKRRKRGSSGGSYKARRQPKRPPQPDTLNCGQCDFTTSSKRIYAAHVKSHLVENVERSQEIKNEITLRKTAQSISKRPSPDRNLMNASASLSSTLPAPNSPPYAPAQSPGLYDFYHNGAGAKYSGSGSSTYSNGSIGPNAERIFHSGDGIGQFLVMNHSGTSSTNSAVFDAAPNTRLIRLDLATQNSTGSEEMASCMQGLQQANGALMQLLRRRENELSLLRSNVMDLLRLLLPNHPAFQRILNVENVDEIVTNALSLALTEASAHK